jgi:hypothetical protein
MITHQAQVLVLCRDVVAFLVNIRQYVNNDRLCGLVVRVLGYISGDPGSILGTTRKKNEWDWNGVHSAS